MTPDEIISAVAEATGVPVGAITGKRRTGGVVTAKTMATALLREAFPWWSLPDLAKMMGRRTHGNVMHHLKRHRDMMETDSSYRKLFIGLIVSCE